MNAFIICLKNVNVHTTVAVGGIHSCVLGNFVLLHFFVTISSTFEIGSVVAVVTVVVVVDDRNGETSVTTLAKPTV